MTQLDNFKEIIGSYRAHGWQLRRVLMREETSNALTNSADVDLVGVESETSTFDAAWFSRPSHQGREAWELRLVGGTPYALFEAFESDLDGEIREETLREMQCRMAEYAARA